MKHFAVDSLAVEKRSVPAIRVFDNIVPVDYRDLRMIPGSPAVANHQVAISLPADPKR